MRAKSRVSAGYVQARGGMGRGADRGGVKNGPGVLGSWSRRGRGVVWGNDYGAETVV